MSSPLRPLNFLQAMIRGVVLPVQVVGRIFQKFTKFKIPPWVRYGMHFILLGLMVALLVFLNLTFEWYKQIDAPAWVRYSWPGLVALLIYAALRLVFYIIAQLPSTKVDFPDIEEAMEEGLAALGAANLDARDVPLFIIVGLSTAEERSFAESTLVGKEIRVDDADLPVHWYGDHRAVWVTLPGISAVTAQTKLSGGAAKVAPEPAAADFANTLSGQEGARFETMGGGGGGRFATLGAAPAEPAAGAPVVGGYHAPARRLDADERDRLQARMAFFVKLLKEHRYPICTTNGILVSVPYAWCTSPGLSQLADTVKLDMQVLHDDLGVKCITILTLTGIEAFPEWKTYIERLDKDQLERRCGCGFPSLITPNNEDVERTHSWLVQYFERQVFELFQRKLGDTSNGDLLRLLDRIRKCRPNLTRILKSAFPDEAREPHYLGGVYLASLQPSGNVRLPFFDGLLARMAREHDDVIGWTDDSLREDRQMHGLARGLLIAAAAFIILDAILILSLFVPLGLG